MATKAGKKAPKTKHGEVKKIRKTRKQIEAAKSRTSNRPLDTRRATITKEEIAGQYGRVSYLYFLAHEPTPEGLALFEKMDLKSRLGIRFKRSLPGTGYTTIRVPVISEATYEKRTASKRTPAPARVRGTGASQAVTAENGKRYIVPTTVKELIERVVFLPGGRLTVAA